jgi:hypothetical protein
MDQRLPAEFLLASACCRWPSDARAEQFVREAAARVVDWGNFAGIVRRNRIAPLAHRALMRAKVAPPTATLNWLSERARKAAALALRQARESLLLQDTFAAAGIPVMTVKGTPVAVLAYGDLGIKESFDIDILVSPEDASKVRLILKELEYTSDIDRLTTTEFRLFMRHGREVAFHSPRTAMNVDLHWRLIDYRGLLRGVDVHSASQCVAIPGGMLRTLANGPLFAHLCVHGAVHNWARFKWLADVGAFVASRPQTEVEALYETACGYGVGRSASVALMLCEQLVGFHPSSSLRRSLESDFIKNALVAGAVASLTHRGGALEHEVHTLPWLRSMAARFVLAPGLAHVFEQARVIWISQEDRMRLLLPAPLSFLYHGLRVPFWIGRICRRYLRRTAS